MRDIQSIISELEQQKSAIDRAIAALREVSGSTAALALGRGGSGPTKKRQMSPEARARIAEAVRRRWAASKGATAAKKTTGSKKATKKAAAKSAAS